ncbi:MAG: hypothetical protein OEW79_03405 [Betaproteobacteria bacterium]|jgi:hypothetical protein|nr:hypothetical protein [Betaproteobacteria bacterium]MDH5341863.1 hypothetical protein [Betaproteobacteria bacterium]
MDKFPGTPDTVAAVPAQQSFARFMGALRHITRFMTGPLLENPLDAAVQRIEANPAFTQYRLLTRLIAALPGEQGEFRVEEASVFDRDTLAVILSLIHAHDAGTTPSAEWRQAIDRAESAQLAFNG